MLIVRRALILRFGVLAAAAGLAAPASAAAQLPTDTTRRVSILPIASFGDSVKTPISPRRAFLYSFLVPGLSQSVLGRHKAGAAFLIVEAISLSMIRESAADVHEARRSANDSLVTSYVETATGPVATKIAPRFGSSEIKTRQAHVEDWVALLVANHLFAGADAFVASHLWDVSARLGLRVLPHGTAVVASFRW